MSSRTSGLFNGSHAGTVRNGKAEGAQVAPRRDRATEAEAIIDGLTDTFFALMNDGIDLPRANTRAKVANARAAQIRTAYYGGAN